MKLNDILNGSNSLTELIKIHFTSFKVTHDLAFLKKKVDEEVKFAIEQEKSIIGRYADKDEKGNPKITNDGRVICSSEENRKTFEFEIQSLRNTEIEEIKMVTIKESDFRSATDIPTPEQLLLLEGLINFE